VTEAADARALADWSAEAASEDDARRDWSEIVLDLVADVDAVYRQERQRWEADGSAEGVDALVRRAEQVADLILRAERAGVLRRLEEHHDRSVAQVGEVVAQCLVSLVTLAAPTLAPDPALEQRLRHYLLALGQYVLHGEGADRPALPMAPGLRLVDDLAPRAPLALPAAPGWEARPSEVEAVWEAVAEAQRMLDAGSDIIDCEVISDDAVEPSAQG
jgi:hypothetical protein